MNDTKYDFHIHYKAHARDASGYEEAMVQRAVEVGLSGICFTEHFQRLPSERILELRAKYPIKIWSGVEVNCAEGSDLLIFGRCEIPEPRRPWGWLHDYCEHNGFPVCLAHPFRKGRSVPSCFVSTPPDYVEIASRNTPVWATSHVAELADAMADNSDIYFLVNSDAHKIRHLGGYFNYRSPEAEQLAEFLERSLDTRATEVHTCPQ